MALDAEDLKQIAALIAAADTKRAEDLPKIVAEQLKPLTASITAAETLAKEAKAAAEKAPPTPEPDKKVADKAPDPAVARLQAEVERMAAEAKRNAEIATAAEAKAKQDRLVNAARDALALAGVPASNLVPAIALLKEQGVLDYDEKTGEPGFKFARKGFSEVIGGKAAAEEWLKTDAGKLYVPPSEVQGNGQRGGRIPNTGSSSAPVGTETLARGLWGKVLGA